MGDVCAELDVDSLSSAQKPITSICSSPYPPTLAIAVLVQRLTRWTAYPMRRNSPYLCPRPQAQTPLNAVLIRRPLPTRTPVHHQATQRRTITTALAAGLRPATNGTC
jgi:hypothetical protein